MAISGAVAAAKNDDLKGNTLDPSWDVPSGNNTMRSPWAKRAFQFCAGMFGGVAAFTVNKHRALQFRKPAKKWPRRNFALGHK